MRIMSLDLSTCTGWAVINDGQLVDYGTIELDSPVNSYNGQSYPWTYVDAITELSSLIYNKVYNVSPNILVIEETNGSKSRYTQKVLEFIHYAVLIRLAGSGCSVQYVNTSDWRKVVGCELTKEQKKQNAKLSKAKSKAKKSGEKLDKKALGIAGRVTKKHVAVALANKLFSLKLLAKDNDIADAILMARAYYLGVKTCDGRK